MLGETDSKYFFLLNLETLQPNRILSDANAHFVVWIAIRFSSDIKIIQCSLPQGHTKK